MEDNTKQEQVCMLCNASSDERPLIQIIHKKEEASLCVRCLPQMIHGAH